MKSNTLKALLPFNSSSKNITGTLERSLRKLKPIQRDNPSTMSGDQITQVDSQMSNSNNESKDDDFSEKVDFTNTSFKTGLSGSRKDAPPSHKMNKISEKMYKRWVKALEQSIPAIDMLDAAPCAAGAGEDYVKRQFAAEYSQAAYETMLNQEYAIGAYITTHG